MSLKGEISLLRSVVEKLITDAFEDGSLFKKSGFIAEYIDQIAKLEKQQMHFGFQRPTDDEIRAAVSEVFEKACYLEETLAEEVVDKAFESEPKDLSSEEYRVYTVLSNDGPSYMILDPQKLWVGETTHRVLDAEGLVHCVPFPNGGKTVLTWKPRDPENPVAF